MYSRLLVPLDGSHTAQLALHHAALLGRLSGGTIVLLHIADELRHSNGFERPMVYIEEVRPGFLAAGQKVLATAAQWLGKEGLPVETVLRESRGERISELIAQEAQASRCNLVILGTHGRRGVDRFLMGSDAEQVARIAPVPVMLVRELPPPVAPEAFAAQVK